MQGEAHRCEACRWQVDQHKEVVLGGGWWWRRRRCKGCLRVGWDGFHDHGLVQVDLHRMQPVSCCNGTSSNKHTHAPEQARQPLRFHCGL